MSRQNFILNYNKREEDEFNVDSNDVNLITTIKEVQDYKKVNIKMKNFYNQKQQSNRFT